MCKIRTITILVVIHLWVVSAVYAGITGSIAGYVKDRETGSPLPGASILVEETTLGAMADKNGFFMIHNLPAGTYNVTAKMIGYTKATVRNVRINVDLVTELNFELSTEVLQLDEITVTQQRDMMQKELTATTYFFSNEDINRKLPIDSFRDAMTLIPGTVGSHIRGARETSALYLLDGLPIQGGLSREISSSFPNSSIVEMMVQTGGFSAEYGQATSGIVNVVSRSGKNQVEGELKLYTDFFDTGLTGSDNTRRVEMNTGGPLTIGLGGPLINANYFVSADLNLSDTQWGEEMRQAFDSPIFRNYNINSKLSFDLTQNTSLILQGLVSNWNWRKYDPQWRLNLQGLAEHDHNSHRLSATLQHTFNPRLFASLKVARYSYHRNVGSAEEPDLEFEDPTDPTSLILSGSQPWNEQTEERIHFFKFDLVSKVSANHLLKAGVEVQDHEMRSRRVNFFALPIRKPEPTIGFDRRNDNFRYYPKFFALYLQDRIELGDIIADLGVRYDYFNPRVRIEEAPQEYHEVRTRAEGPPPNLESDIHGPISPRLGLSMPLSDQERLVLNYGWFYQMPPLYFLYTNAEHRITGPIALIGNPKLEPIKTVASEFSYKRAFSEDFMLVLTGFSKKFTSLVDTQSFLVPDSVVYREGTALGYSRYTSSAFGRAAGLEITFQKRFGSHFSTRLSYTLMKAEGTSSRPEDAHNLAVTGAPPFEPVEYPLSWDQRHSVVFNADYRNRDWQVNMLFRLFSPLPFTEPGSAEPNNARLSWRELLDVKIINMRGFLNGRLHPYLELRNLFNEKTRLDALDDTGVRAYRLFDPTNLDFGRRLRIGFVLDF